MYLSPIYIVEDKVEFLWGLEGVVEPNQKRVFQTFQQHISLCHNVLLLQRDKRKKQNRRKAVQSLCKTNIPLLPCIFMCYE